MKFCPQCRTELALLSVDEDGGPKQRLRCPACAWTHWNNPVPVLAAVLECVDRGGQLLLARNAAWPGRFFGLVTGFMEAGESPEAGVLREVAEETALRAVAPPTLLGVWDFQKMNQLIVAYHVAAEGEIVLSPELAEYKLFEPARVRCWPQGTGQALATFVRSRGHEPQWME
jgi:NAD+ diphosphatase